MTRRGWVLAVAALLIALTMLRASKEGMESLPACQRERSESEFTAEERAARDRLQSKLSTFVSGWNKKYPLRKFPRSGYALRLSGGGRGCYASGYALAGEGVVGMNVYEQDGLPISMGRENAILIHELTHMYLPQNDENHNHGAGYKRQAREFFNFAHSWGWPLKFGDCGKFGQTCSHYGICSAQDCTYCMYNFMRSCKPSKKKWTGDTRAI